MAMSAAERARRYRNRLRGGPPRRQLEPCGTRAAAARHRRHGEQVCDTCRQAERDYIAEKQRERRRKHS